MLVIFVWRWLPESPRWLDSHGYHEEADIAVRLLEAEAITKTSAPLPDPIDADQSVPTAQASDLLRQGYLRRTAVLGIGYGLALVGYYGFTAWLPTLLTENGLTGPESLAYTSILSLAAVPGTLGAMLFIDKFERKTAIFFLFVVIGIFMLLFGISDTPAIVLASGLVITFLMYAGSACFYTYMPEIFPTHLRALGAGTANGIARMMTFASTFILAALLSTMGFTPALIFLAAAMISTGLILGLFGERTKNLTQESISQIGRAHV